jgi:hypothetical protein
MRFATEIRHSIQRLQFDSPRMFGQTTRESAPDQEPGVAPATSAKVVGIDGKEYPARRDVPDDKDDDVDPENVKAALVIKADTAAENARTINYLITRHPESVTREAKKAIREAAQLWFRLDKKV